MQKIQCYVILDILTVEYCNFAIFKSKNVVIFKMWGIFQLQNAKAKLHPTSVETVHICLGVASTQNITFELSILA